MMRKRLLSLLLAIVMVLPLVPAVALPTLAAEAEVGKYSTQFAVGNENYPKLSEDNSSYTTGAAWQVGSMSVYARAQVVTTTTTTVTVTETAMGAVIGKPTVTTTTETGDLKTDLGFSKNFPLSETSETAEVDEEAGTTTTTTTVITRKADYAAENVYPTGTFAPYNLVITSDSAGYLITNGGKNNNWGSVTTGGGQGGCLYLTGGTYGNVMTMGVNYPGDITANYRPVNSCYATSCVRYTAEYTGNVTVDFAVGYHNKANGTRLVIRHTSASGDPVGNYTYAALTASGSETLDVKQGDTIDFISMPDLNYDYDSYTAGTFDYNLPKRGIKNPDFTVTYNSYLPDPEAWNADAYTLTYKDRSSADILLFRWYDDNGTAEDTTDDTPITTVHSSANLSYATINPTVMTAAGITEDMTYEQAFAQYRVYLKSLSKLDYTGNWRIKKSNGDDILYYGYGVAASPFGLRVDASGSQLGLMGIHCSWLAEDDWETVMDTLYAATFSDTIADYVDFDASTLVKNIKVAYNTNLRGKETTSTEPAKNLGRAVTYSGLETARADFNVSADPIYFRAPNYYTHLSYAWTASYDGTVQLSLDKLIYNCETIYPYFAWGVYVNGEAYALTMPEGVTLASSMMTAKLASGATIPAGDLTELGTASGMYYDASRGYYNVKVGAANGSTKYAGTATEADAWYTAMQALLANTSIPVSRGDVVELRITRSTAYDNNLASNNQSRPAWAGAELTATMTEAKTSADVQLVINTDYALNLYVWPVAPNVTGAGVMLEDGTQKAGVLQTTGAYKGSYKLTLEDHIPVYDLETMSVPEGKTDPVHDYAGVSCTFTPYETGYYTATPMPADETTISTGRLLQVYIDNGDEETAELARAIQALAVASWAYNNGETIDGETKFYLKGEPTIHSVTLATLRETLGLAADTPLYAYDATTKTYKPYSSEYTNSDSGLGEIELAILKYHFGGAEREYYPNYPVYTANGDGTYTKLLHPFPFDEYVNVYTPNVSKPAYGEGATTMPYIIRGMNVELGDKVRLSFAVAANGESELAALKNGCRIQVAVDGKVIENLTCTEFKTHEIAGVTYMVATVDVPIKLYDKDLALTVVNASGEAISATLTHSVEAWCINKATLGNYGMDDYVVRAVRAVGRASLAYDQANS